MLRPGLLRRHVQSGSGRGVAGRQGTVEYTPDEFDAVFDTNLRSTFALCQALHPALKAAGRASVVFNTSVAGVVAIWSGTPYAATKARCAAVAAVP